MPTATDFLTAIAAAPHDPTRRLVYADWLDEQGDAVQAEYVRVCVEQQSLELRPGVPVPWHARRHEELGRRAAGLRAGRPDPPVVPGGVPPYQPVGGLPTAVTLTARQLAEHGAAVFARWPTVYTLLLGRFGRFGRFGRQAADAAGSPALRRVRTLRLTGSGLTLAHVRAVLASPHLRRLNELDADSMYATLGRRLADAVARAAPGLGGLTRLGLGGHQMGDAGVRALATDDRLAGLTELRLAKNLLTSATPLLAGRWRLQSLTLDGNGFDEFEVGALARSPALDGLRELSLTHSSTPAGLFDSPRLPALERLDVSYNSDLPREVFAPLAGGEPVLPALAELNLSACGLTAEAVAALARADRLTGLRRLDLSANWFRPAGVMALVNGPVVERLESLDLSYCRLRNDGAKAVAGSPELAGLRALSLRANEITDAGARHLIESKHLARLAYLDLRGNRLKKATQAVLAERFGANGYWFE